MIYASVMGDSATYQMSIRRKMGEKGRPPKTSGSQVSIWLSKCITLTGPQWSFVERNADSVVVWSPPNATILGTV